FQIASFPNQEIYAKINTNVADKDCIILGSISPPAEQLISFLFLSHTLKKERAFKITAFLPYLAYARQDKIKKGESLATSTIGEIFRASHINEVVTVDVHSPQTESLFPLPIYNLSPANLFAKEIKKLGLKNPSFVSPDEGAIERTQAVLDALNIKTDISYMRKTRTQVEVTSTLYGHVGRDVVVVDDILDTGKTLLACCEILKCAGAKNIYIFVTHGLFTGNEWQDLFNLNVKKIYCTDSVPQVYSLKVKNLEILPIKPLFREYADRIRKIKEEVKRITRRTKSREQNFLTS
ncbi:MAG: ribose-phosphate diphosphokinase, partial [Candidatus Daviesbacteria bacterium]|nr:ribose-phosphate diphosphokinase [Candidatus Daviesbacteria bacterium]